MVTLSADSATPHSFQQLQKFFLTVSRRFVGNPAHSDEQSTSEVGQYTHPQDCLFDIAVEEPGGNSLDTILASTSSSNSLCIYESEPLSITRGPKGTWSFSYLAPWK
ncbi:hypothetical protein AB1N83_012025 [Pleurotus pulmonarius]